MTLIFSQRVKKAIKKMNRAGRKDIIDSFDTVVTLLAKYDQKAQINLRVDYDDHALKGNMRGFRELHLGQDVLLIYRIHGKNLIEVRHIFTHEELRKRHAGR